LIIIELLGPWTFGVAMFTVLVTSALYLAKVSDYLVQGVPAAEVFKFTALILPGVLVKTFTMAMLLATLLAFGRLSSDSEIVAMRAAGASIYRIVWPALLFSMVVAALAYALTETVVPPATREMVVMRDTIARTANVKSLNLEGIPLRMKGTGDVWGELIARDADLAAHTFRGITIVVFGRRQEDRCVVMAHELDFDADQFAKNGGGWVLRGTTVYYIERPLILHIPDKVWPSDVPRPDIGFQDLLLSTVKDGDAFTTAQLWNEIAVAAANPEVRHDELANYEFWFWNKLALPLAAIVFGLLGAPLGIRNTRTSAATGFALAVAILFVYDMLVNMLNTFAEGGAIPAYVASFTPLIVGALCALAIMKRRNL
jgi:lipopolysaccharide export system permease protein